MIRPCFWKKDKEKYKIWGDGMEKVENSYNQLISMGGLSLKRLEAFSQIAINEQI